MNAILAVAFGPEVWIVIGVVVLLFGGSQLPKLAKSVGEAKKEFEKTQKDDKKELKKDSSSEEA